MLLLHTLHCIICRSRSGPNIQAILVKISLSTEMDSLSRAMVGIVARQKGVYPSGGSASQIRLDSDQKWYRPAIASDDVECDHAVWVLLTAEFKSSFPEKREAVHL